MTQIGIAPFGSKGPDSGIIAANILADNCPKDAKADKWRVLRHCISAKMRFACRSGPSRRLQHC